MLYFNSYSLTTDRYQLAMADAYLHEGIAETPATFSLFVRDLPQGWSYLIACGIDDALGALEDLEFVLDDTAFLRDQGFSLALCDYLRNFAFKGTVRAVPEGTPFYANEPILEVSGTLIETQLVETLLLTLINYPTLIASKASRIVRAAHPIPVVDFGLRRGPGPEAAVRAARAAFIAGVTSTSNVEAGRQYGIPSTGTMAHSYVMAHKTEVDAFRAWCAANPDGATLLIDTYDVETGVRHACQVVREGAALKAVRIDSGNLKENTFRVRSILNDAGLQHVRIIVSGDMNEEKIRGLKEAKRNMTFGNPPTYQYTPAPIDGYGVGTDMITARPQSVVGGVYKLVEVGGRPVVKTSIGKPSLPGRKQVWRFPEYDVIADMAETCPDGRPLLQPVMVGGETLNEPKSVQDVAAHCRAELALCRIGVRDDVEAADVRVSDALQALREKAVVLSGK